MYWKFHPIHSTGTFNLVSNATELRAYSAGLNMLISSCDVVGEVGLRKHHPRSATPATFGLRTVSVSWGSLRRTGADETLMPLCHVSFVVQE
jgi:hypothetical protein